MSSPPSLRRLLTDPPLIATLVVLALGVAWVLLSRPGPVGSSAVNAQASPRIGRPAPDFTLDTLDGGTIALAALRGRPVMLNFWASWCEPCRTEMPAIQKVFARQDQAGPIVIGLNVTSEDSEAAAREFAQEFGLTFPIALDRDGTATAAYQLLGLPSTYFIDEQGIVRDVIVGGPMSESTMQAKLDQLMPH